MRPDDRVRRFVLVAGEVSGDKLGAALIRGLKANFPNAHFEGIGGPEMQAEGLYSLASMERLSVMGVVEVLGRLRELLRLRKDIAHHYRPDPPDCFIGIDAPDFNLDLAAQFKAMGALAVHFVSPSIWAWRPERVDKIVKKIDLMLTLFPFEVAPYRQRGLMADHVGHPMADQIDFNPDKGLLRSELGLDDKRTLAILPGSRRGEVKRIAPVFAKTLRRLADPDLQVVVPCATPALRPLLERLFAGLSVHILDGQARQAMGASDAVLLASGTAALEAALVGRPMVVAYRLNPLTAWYVKRKLQVEHVSLPNHLTRMPRVPEFLQEHCHADNLVPAVSELLSADHSELMLDFEQVHDQLARSAASRAAAAISSVLHRQ